MIGARDRIKGMNHVTAKIRRVLPYEKILSYFPTSTILKYRFTLIAQSVSNEVAPRRTVRKPFNLHNGSPNIHSPLFIMVANMKMRFAEARMSAKAKLIRKKLPVLRWERRFFCHKTIITRMFPIMPSIIIRATIGAKMETETVDQWKSGKAECAICVL